MGAGGLSGQPPIQSRAQAVQGRALFSGQIKRRRWRRQQGFLGLLHLPAVLSGVRRAHPHQSGLEQRAQGRAAFGQGVAQATAGYGPVFQQIIEHGPLAQGVGAHGPGRITGQFAHFARGRVFGQGQHFGFSGSESPAQLFPRGGVHARQIAQGIKPGFAPGPELPHPDAGRDPQTARQNGPQDVPGRGQLAGGQVAHGVQIFVAQQRRGLQRPNHGPHLGPGGQVGRPGFHQGQRHARPYRAAAQGHGHAQAGPPQIGGQPGGEAVREGGIRRAEQGDGQEHGLW